MDLNQVTVPSRDIARSIRFYETLGLNLIVRSLPHYARFECPEGGSTFSVHLVDELPGPEGVYIYFEVKDVEKTVSALEESGLTVDESPELKRWLWKEARLRDPDGNRIIIYYAGDNRKDPPWRLKPGE
ncbi:VOC family protein [Aureitalea marina]|uniref:Bleomycin resistance protein n=1 Tax=Aureitalea marina TaxID=930804 RepID=A0A2S7KRW4_9FLAO|nr:VOC family protein [Aureitalea marina]PQB05347.1 bleomycin resistance protein [Aureitalea marina]